MSTAKQLAKHLKEVHNGPNWTSTHLKEVLKDVDWQEATTKLPDFNTIAALVYHIHYFVHVTIPVFEGGKLDAHDKFSFDVPPINSEEDWQQLLATVWADADRLVQLISELPDSKLWEVFADEMYGSYYRNIQGIIEHTHYHLGQIVILKKLISK